MKRIEKFGAFVEIFSGKDGLVHISEIAEERIKKVEDVLKIGDEILVKVLEIDNQGRVNLSRKAVLKEQNENSDKKSKVRNEPGFFILISFWRSQSVCFFCCSTLSYFIIFFR